MSSQSTQRSILKQNEPSSMLLAIHRADGSYGPETLKVMGLAFDQAWAEIAPNFDRDGRYSQIMRQKLAKAVLSVATYERRDVEVLKNEALQSVAMTYRT